MSGSIVVKLVEDVKHSKHQKEQVLNKKREVDAPPFLYGHPLK